MSGPRPETKLNHPLFVGAVALLAINDHVLKGSGLLAGALTGKLSDVAGLVAAPLVLAWLLRVRTRRAWLAVHLAVALGFSLLQVPLVAMAIEDVARVLGLGLRLWADPSDLLALPALAVSFRVFGAASSKRAHGGAVLLGLAALVVCSATSAPGSEPAPRYPFPPAGVLNADVFVRHMGSQDLVIAVRPLRDDREVDCDAVMNDPVGALEGDDFGDEQEWRLARGDGVPLWDRRGGWVDRACYAVRMKVRDRDWVFAWRHDAPAVRELDIRLDADQVPEDDAVQIVGSPDDPPSVPEGVVVRLQP
ncbi:MAG: hypothetical protein AB8I08_23005 [Sandaracinaceae bacterium]